MNNAPHVCPLCGGTGKPEEEERQNMYGDCRACGGKGIVWPPNAYYPVPQPAPAVPPYWPHPLPLPPWYPGKTWVYCGGAAYSQPLTTEISVGSDVVFRAIDQQPTPKSTLRVRYP